MKNDIKIQSNVPAPRHRGRWGALLGVMNPGDSVLLNRKDALHFQQAVSNNFKTFKVTMRKEGKEYRCWKLLRDGGEGGRRKKIG